MVDGNKCSCTYMGDEIAAFRHILPSKHNHVQASRKIYGMIRSDPIVPQEVALLGSTKTAVTNETPTAVAVYGSTHSADNSTQDSVPENDKVVELERLRPSVLHSSIALEAPTAIPGPVNVHAPAPANSSKPRTLILYAYY